MKMKKLLALGIAFLLCASCVMSVSAQHAGALGYGAEWSGYTSTSVTNFRDVPSTHWAVNSIDRVIAKGWMEGYPDNSFHPDAQITRAEAMTVFMKFLGIQPQAVTTTSFSDISANQWYAPYIEAGKELFPAKATFNGQTPFLPNQPITREDVSYALVKAKKYDSAVASADLFVLNMFKDQNSISANVKPYVAVAVSNGLISGYPDGTIGAQDPLTRAEFATMLYRATFAGTN